MLAAGTLKQHRNFTKSGERSQHDRTNLSSMWTGCSVAGQQSAAKTSRNGNKKEAVTVKLMGTGGNLFGSK